MPHNGGDTFIVQPAIGQLTSSWLELFGVRTVNARLRQTRSLSDEGDFFGLRAYRPGDSPRYIHWRSSARRDELVVKQFQQADSRELIVLLDLFPSSNVGEENRDSHQKHEDLAIEFVATLASHIASSNFGVITVAIADFEPMIASLIQSRSQNSGLLDRLALAHFGTEDKIDVALNLLEREFRRVENLMVVSTRPRIEFQSHGNENSGIVLWRAMTWLDVSAGELTKYFAPAA